MNKKALSIIILTVLFITSCGTDFKKEFVANFQKGPNGTDVPEPKFDRPIADILNDLKSKYDVTSVRLERPFTYSNEQNLKYWIKVAFLNPEIGDKSTKDFEREIATEIAGYLTNPADFDEIEVSVTQKKGFIVTFSTSENSFYSVDSLLIKDTAGVELHN